MESINQNKLKFTFLFIIFSTSIFGWGRTGHINISKHAFELLKQKMNVTQMYNDSVVAMSINPDKRVRTIKEQAPWHYIDIDFYQEFNNLDMITNYDTLISKYGEEEVKRQGTLPWVIQTNQNKLIEAFTNKNFNDILYYSAEVAHFVADAHMALHTTTNYDGQLTNQKGIHSRYESKMVEKYLDKIVDGFYNQQLTEIDDPLLTAFDIIDNSFSFIEIILDSDKKANELAHSTSTDMYYAYLWKQTDYITYIQMNNAAKFVASYIYSAWYKAGMPKIDNLIN
ncbi:MAG TPA: S1/P1 nuclease [Melioribacteraceae bacterium]|nr:S1/P1 nuclease [Melioribacteraceae bacterium]